jgi:hypothetical protein
MNSVSFGKLRPHPEEGAPVGAPVSKDGSRIGLAAILRDVFQSARADRNTLQDEGRDC